MKVRIISSAEMNAWILGKMARKLRDELLALGVEADIGDAPDPTADINHYMLYLMYDAARKSAVDSLMITHIDNQAKLEQIKSFMRDARIGICMSAQTMHLLEDFSIDPARLCYVNPAHDSVVAQRRVTIGLTFKVYEDGRKREQFLVRLAEEINPLDFRFKIMGEGWEKIVEQLRGKGFETDYYPEFDYDRYTKLIAGLDYYLYMGQDEGSMGFVDALSAGVKTIVTPQGYHLDAPHGISHSFDSVDELIHVFGIIAGEKKQLTHAVRDWTWQHYAKKHKEIWEFLLGRETSSSYPDGLNSLLHKSAGSGSIANRIRVRYKILRLTLSRFMHSKDKLGKIKRKIMR